MPNDIPIPPLSPEAGAAVAGELGTDSPPPSDVGRLGPRHASGRAMRPSMLTLGLIGALLISGMPLEVPPREGE